MKKAEAKLRGKNIVFVNQATGYLTIDIINEFANEFDKVAAIYGDIRVQDIDLSPKVLRSKVIEKSRKSNLKRFNRWFIASVQIFWLLIMKYRKFDIFYFSVPPFAYLTSLILRRRFSIFMWDVYPDALIMAGLNDRSFICQLWTKANFILFRRAYRVFTIGDVLRDRMSKYVTPEKIQVIPLWSGLINCEPINKADNPFIVDQQLEGKFLVQYSGNIEAGHNIETLIQAALLTRSDEQIFYLITGRGSKIEVVKSLIAENGLTNCRVLPFQPDDMIRYSFAAADLSVVLVEDRIAGVSIPSKVYNLMAVGSPIVSIAPLTSEISKLVMRFDNGRNFEKDNVEGLAAFITEMKHSPEILRSFRERSIIASSEFTRANAHKFLEIYKSSEK